MIYSVAMNGFDCSVVVTVIALLPYIAQRVEVQVQ